MSLVFFFFVFFFPLYCHIAKSKSSLSGADLCLVMNWDASANISEAAYEVTCHVGHQEIKCHCVVKQWQCRFVARAEHLFPYPASLPGVTYDRRSRHTFHSKRSMGQAGVAGEET